jgi:response regulator of citrate/malate metabolism
MEALGWRVSEDGSACVLSASRGIGEHTLQTLQDRIKAMVAKLAARQAAREIDL